MSPTRTQLSFHLILFLVILSEEYRSPYGLNIYPRSEPLPNSKFSKMLPDLHCIRVGSHEEWSAKSLDRQIKHPRLHPHTDRRLENSETN